MQTVHAAFWVCWKDLRQQLRSRTALLVAVVIPLLLTLLMGLALGNSPGFRMRLAIVDLDQTPTSLEFRAYAERPELEGLVYVENVADPGAARALLRAEDTEAAVILEKGFAVAVASREPVELQVLVGDNTGTAGAMTRLMAQDFVNRARAPLAERPPSVLQVSPGGQMRLIDFFGPSMAVLFLTLSVLTGVRALQFEIQNGTIARLRAVPCHAMAIYAGKFGALLLIGLLQMTSMILATSLLFGTHWGNPLPVAMLVVSSALMAIGLAAFFVSLATTIDTSQSIATVSIFLLAVIGGQFLPPQGLPDIFETLSRLTPNGQAFRGFTDLAAAGAAGSLATVREPLLVTAAVGILGVGIAALRAKNALLRVTV